MAKIETSCEVLPIKRPEMSSFVDLPAEDFWTLLTQGLLVYQNIDQLSFCRKNPQYVHPEFTLERLQKAIRRDGGFYPLTPSEYSLIDLFSIFPNRIIPTSLLATQFVGGDDADDIDALKVQIFRVRQKIKTVPAAVHPLQAVRGEYGYRLNDPSRQS